MKFFKYLFFITVVFVVTIILKVDAAYTIHDIGTLATEESLSFSMNQSGTIAGMFFDGDREKSTDFIWDSINGLQIITTDGIGVVPLINNEGVVVGGIKDDDGVSQLYLYDKKKGLQKIGKPEGWEEFTILTFKDGNQLLVFSLDRQTFSKWENGRFYQGYLLADDWISRDAFLALNNHGMIVVIEQMKTLSITSANRRWFSRETLIIRNGAFVNYHFPNNYDNDNNETAGTRWDQSKNPEGYFWTKKDSFLSLGNFFPLHINNRREIIGFTSEDRITTDGGVPLDYKLGVWKEGKVIDLDDLISVENNFVKNFEKMVFLTVINDAGQIVGIAEVSGNRHVVFLDPIIEKETPLAKAAKEEWEQLSPDQQAWYHVEVDHAIALIQQRHSQ